MAADPTSSRDDAVDPGPAPDGAGAPVPSATLTDGLRALLRVTGPSIAQGVIARRPALVRLADRWEADAGTVHEMQRLRRTYGRGPVRVRLPGRELALVLDPDDAHRVLRETPETFTAANAEKRASLGQFQPHGVLISEGARRQERRQVNEDVLDTGHPVHADAEAIVAGVRTEVAQLLSDVGNRGVLDWDAAHRAWRRTVRRVVLGEQARDDEHVHTLMDRLRGFANWSFAAPRARRSRAALRERLRHHLEHATDGSLAARLRDEGGAADELVDQIPQWLFAADPALMAAHRALALLASEDAERARAREQIDAARHETAPLLARLRAAVLESVRLWPTTPLILRDTTGPTTWPTGTMAAGTGVLVVAPYLHRDEQIEPTAHRFAPGNWLAPDGERLDEHAHDHRPLVPFSEGPASCPGQDLVLLMTSTWLAALLSGHDVALRHRDAPLDPTSLPASLSPFATAFTLTGRS
jgi:cytochrome P450